jgi:hypothetical protein
VQADKQDEQSRSGTVDGPDQRAEWRLVDVETLA